MDGDFFVGAALATTLTKLALRYITLQKEPKKQNVSHKLLTVLMIFYKEKKVWLL